MKTLFISVILCLISIFHISAQGGNDLQIKTRKNFFYVAPCDLLLNTFQTGYERGLKNHNTLAFNVGFKLGKQDQIIHRIGGTGELQYRINLLYNKEAISNIARRASTFAYFSPFVMYRYEEINDPVYSESNDKVNSTFVNSGFGGLGFGLRFTGLENRFCMNLYAGGGLKYSDVKGDIRYADFFEVGYTGIAPKINFQIGITF